MFTICSRHRPSRRSPGRCSDGPGHGPVKPESAGFGPIPGKTRGFLADTTISGEVVGRVTLMFHTDPRRRVDVNRRDVHGGAVIRSVPDSEFWTGQCSGADRDDRNPADPAEIREHDRRYRRECRDRSTGNRDSSGTHPLGRHGSL